MADYFTHFSCLLDVGSIENAHRALGLYDELSEGGVSEFPPSEGFQLSINPDKDGTELWLHDEVSGDPESIMTCWLSSNTRTRD